MTHLLVEEWPREGLERSGRCPVCGKTGRELMLDGLIDLSFRTAPGRWTMWRCASCRGAYLDPRPSPTSIGRAYEKYYTHVAAEPAALSTDSQPTQVIRRALATRALRMLSRSASVVERFLPSLPVPAAAKLSNLLHIMRHLPPARPSDRLLDIGCGDGRFLGLAGRLGYAATGLDFDEVALASARRAGLDVRLGSLPGSGLPDASFAQITFSNVLEHLHDPVAALDEALRLLQPGGRLWLSQPNLDAAGLKLFGRSWRGLEAPRHLVLWTPDGLLDLLHRRGFADARSVFPDIAATGFYYRQSFAQQSGLDPYDATAAELDDRSRRSLAERIGRDAAEATRHPETAETVTIVAFKR